MLRCCILGVLVSVILIAVGWGVVFAVAFRLMGLLDFMCFRFSGLVIFWLVVAIHLSGVFWVC